MSRPYPQFTNIIQTTRNDGKIDYDSLQVVGNKRWAQGFTHQRQLHVGAALRRHRLGAGHAAQPSGNALNAYIDNATQQINKSPYFTHRKHRLTLSGVWELPFAQNSTGLTRALAKGWSVAPMYVYQSGQPWLLPANTELVGRSVGEGARRPGSSFTARSHAWRSATRRPATTSCSPTPSPTAAPSRSS